MNSEVIRMKKYILTIYNKDLPSLSLPAKWEVLKVNKFSEGISAFEQFPPSFLLIPNENGEGNAQNFLKEVGKKYGTIPPSIVWGLSDGQNISEEEKATLGIISIFKGEPHFEEVLKQIEPFLKEPPLPPMTLTEFLSTIVNEEKSGVYEADFFNPFNIIFKKGKIIAILEKNFIQIYRNLLVESGLQILPDGKELLEELTGIESLPVMDRDKFQGIKNLAIYNFLSLFPLDRNVKFKKIGDDIPQFDFIESDSIFVLRNLIERIPLPHIELLKKCSFKSNHLERNTDIMILPDEGYLLHFIGKETSYEELKATISLSESALLRKIYFLFALGFIATIPGGGTPNTIQHLAKQVKLKERLIKSQSIAIEQFSRALQIPGISPYQVLGIASSTPISDALEAFQYLQLMFCEEKLEHSVKKKFAKHLCLIKSKLTEAILLIENLHLKEIQKGGRDGKTEMQQAGSRNEGEAKKVEEDRKKEAEKLLNFANQLIEGEQYYDACQYLKTALIYNPFSAPCRNLLGLTYLKLGGARTKYSAEKELKLAIEYDPWNITYVTDLAKFYIQEGMPARAKTLLEHASRIDPNANEIKEVKNLLKTAG